MHSHDHARAIAVVRDVIHKWDPFSLMKGGTTDEWDREIASVVRQIPRIKSSNDAIHAVSRIFTSAFSMNFSPEHCTEVGQKLYLTLVQHGILESDE